MSKNVSNILSGPIDVLRVPKESLGKYLFECLKKRDPSEIVNIDAHTKEVVTCEKLLQDSIKLSLILHEFELQNGDAIAISSENTIHYFAIVLAGLYTGIIVNPLNPVYTIGELRHALQISKPKLIFCAEVSLENMVAMQREFNFINTIVLMGASSPKNLNIDHSEIKILKDMLATTIVGVESFKPDTSFHYAEHGAFILLSSGTTGLPKGVLLTHANLREPLIYLSNPKYGNVTVNDIILLVLPFFHVFGLLVQLAAITTSMKLVIMDKFKPEPFLQSVESYRVTKLFVVPPLLLFLAKSRLVDDYDISSVKNIMVAGAAVGKQLHKEASERLTFATIRQIYGLTEVCGASTYQTTDKSKPGSIGPLVPNISAKVRHLDTNEALGSLKTGELCFKGPMIMKEYYNNPQATQDCFDQDGFYCTGDLGFYDDDNDFYLVGRLKELIKYKGFQVSPTELEAIILTYPGVNDCGVIGIPNKRAGEVPLAYVVCQNARQLTEQEIIDYVGENISVQKHLYGGVVFIGEIPKSPSGKILRRKLLKMYEASKQKPSSI